MIVDIIVVEVVSYRSYKLLQTEAKVYSGELHVQADLLTNRCTEKLFTVLAQWKKTLQ